MSEAKVKQNMKRMPQRKAVSYSNKSKLDGKRYSGSKKGAK